MDDVPHSGEGGRNLPTLPPFQPRELVLGSASAAAIYIGRMVDHETRLPVGKYNYDGELNLVMIGPNGCGKSTREIVPVFLTIDGRSLVTVDTKGQLTLITAAYRHMMGNKVKVIDPFGIVKKIARRYPELYTYLIEHDLIESCGFNPLASLDPDSPTFYDDAALISEALIKVQGNDPFFSETAQGFVTALIMWAVKIYGRNASLQHVRAMMTEPDKWERFYDEDAGKMRERLVAGLSVTAAKMVAEGGYEIASLAARFMSETPTDGMEDVRATAESQTRWLLSRPVREDLKKNGIDFSELKTGDQPITCYVVLPPEMLEVHSVWLRIVTACAMRGAMQPGGRRVLYIADEFAALGRMSYVERIYPVCRDYKLQIYLICQDLSQLKSIYPDRYETFLGMAGVVLSFRAGTGDLSTVEWLSKRAGTTTAIVDGLSITAGQSGAPPSVTRSINQAEVPFLRPGFMYGLPDGYLIAFLAGKKNPMLLCAPRYDRVDEWAARANPNPYQL